MLITKRFSINYSLHACLRISPFSGCIKTAILQISCTDRTEDQIIFKKKTKKSFNIFNFKNMSVFFHSKILFIEKIRSLIFQQRHFDPDPPPARGLGLGTSLTSVYGQLAVA